MTVFDPDKQDDPAEMQAALDKFAADIKPFEKEWNAMTQLPEGTAQQSPLARVAAAITAERARWTIAGECDGSRIMRRRDDRIFETVEFVERADKPTEEEYEAFAAKVAGYRDLACARVAVLAIREPTEAMRKAGDLAQTETDGVDKGTQVAMDSRVPWQAMIDAVLSEGANP